MKEKLQKVRDTLDEAIVLIDSSVSIEEAIALIDSILAELDSPELVEKVAKIIKRETQWRKELAVDLARATIEAITV